jgi:hypothetical protein
MSDRFCEPNVSKPYDHCTRPHELACWSSEGLTSSVGLMSPLGKDALPTLYRSACNAPFSWYHGSGYTVPLLLQLPLNRVYKL